MRKVALVFLVFSASVFAQNVTCYANPSTSSSGTAVINANMTSGSYNVSLSAWQLSVPCLTSKVTYSVKRADNTPAYTYDIGLDCAAGNCNHNCGTGADACLYAHTGALQGIAFAPVLGSVTQNWISTTTGCTSYPCTLPSGLYAVSVGTTCTVSTKCAELAADDPNGGQIMAFAIIQGGTYAAGLPANVAVPPISPQIATTSNNLPTMLQLLIY